MPQVNSIRSSSGSVAWRWLGVLLVYLACYGIIFPPNLAPQVWGQVGAEGTERSLSQVSDEQEAALRQRALQAYVQMAEQALQRLPRETFDLTAVAGGLGNDPEAALHFVRGSTVWVPYRGSLRGAAGVLMDRLGNSYDRALLLAALLEQGGREVRLAGRELTEAQSRQALQQFDAAGELPEVIYPRPGLQQELPALDAAMLGQAGEGLAGAIVEMQLARERAVQRAAPQAHAVLDAVRQVSAEAGENADNADNAEAQRLAAIAQHVWVQHRAGASEAWQDADPLGLSASPGEPQRVWALDAIPPEDRHRVTIRVIAERWHDQKLDEQVALSRTLFPADLVGRHLTFTNVPLGLAEAGAPAADEATSADARLLAVTEYLPTLAVGDDESHQEQSVRTDGTLNARPNRAVSGQKIDAAVGALGGLAQPAKVSGSWTAQWLEYVIEVPGEAPRVVRRQVFDLLGPGLRRASGSDKAADGLAEQVQQRTGGDAALLQRAHAVAGLSDIVVLPCNVSPEFVAALQLRQVTANRTPLMRMLYIATRGDAGGEEGREEAAATAMQALGELKMEPTYLYRFLLQRALLSPYAQEIYVDRPLVLASHARFNAPAGQQEEDAAAEMSLAIDLVSLPLGVRSDRGLDRFAVRVGQGVIDTYLESQALPDGTSVASADGGENASTLHALFMSGEMPWVPLPPAGGGDDATAAIELPDDVEGRIAAALQSGQMVVAPPAPAREGGKLIWAYWQIDPRTGECVGIGINGWGSETKSYAGIVTGIALKLMGIARLYGTRLFCLYCAATVAIEVLNNLLKVAWLIVVVHAIANGQPPPSGGPPQFPTPSTDDEITNQAIAEAIAMVCEIVCGGKSPKRLTGPPKPPKPPKFGPPPRRSLPPPRGGPNPAPLPKPPRTKSPPPNTMPR